MKQETKFEEIIDNYLNGNISDTKDQIKKLSKNSRKLLYRYFQSIHPNRRDDNFFFALI